MSPSATLLAMDVDIASACGANLENWIEHIFLTGVSSCSSHCSRLDLTHPVLAITVDLPH